MSKQTTHESQTTQARIVGERDIVITRHFDAPIDRVFSAWTEPKAVQVWWDPAGTPLASCDIDLRPGGSFRFVHAGASGHVFAGHYREIDPPRRLVFTTPAPSGGDTVGTLEFTEQGGRTLLTMTMTSASREARDQLLKFGVDQGTVRTMENLARFLAITRLPPLEIPRGP